MRQCIVIATVTMLALANASSVNAGSYMELFEEIREYVRAKACISTIEPYYTYGSYSNVKRETKLWRHALGCDEMLQKIQQEYLQ